MFVGNAWDPQDGRETPWLDVAAQLAGAKGVEALGKAAKTTPPGTEAIARVFQAAGAPVLLLFDEVLNFLNRHRAMAESFHAFIQNLTVATTGTTHGAAVISLPRSQVEMTDWDMQWQDKISKVVRRVAKDLIANDETEISEVIRRRLFQDLGNERVRKNVTKAFADWCFERRAQLPPEWTAVDTAATEAKAREFLCSRFQACYPFHPAQLGESRLVAAIDADIAGEHSHARALDADTKGPLRDIHRRVATAILFESSGGQTDKVAHLPELRFALGEPEVDTTSVDNAAFALEDKSYFIRRVGSDGFKIGHQPTMKKVVSDRRASLDEESEIRPTLRNLVDDEFRRGASLPVVPFPRDGAEVADTPRLTLVIVEPETEWTGFGSLRTQLAEWTKNRGKSPRLYPGALVWCLKKPGRDLREKVELALAWKRVSREIAEGTLGGDFGLASGQKPDGTYERFWFNEPVALDEVAFESGVFLLTRKKAETLRTAQGGDDTPEPPSEPTPPLPTGGDTTTDHTGTPTPTVDTTAITRTIRLAGTVPPELWNRLGTKIIPKLRSGSELALGVEFTLTVPSERSAALIAELRQILEDLDLSNRVGIEETS